MQFRGVSSSNHGSVELKTPTKGAKFIQSIAGGLTESFVPESVVKWGIFKPMTARRRGGARLGPK